MTTHALSMRVLVLVNLSVSYSEIVDIVAHIILYMRKVYYCLHE
jgi:hypothetical protein